MKGLIIQPCGLGDILFLIKIAVRLLETKKVTEIIWPVSKHYSYIDQYIKIDNITFVSEEKDFEYKQLYVKKSPGIYYENNVLVINFQSADEVIESCNDNKPMYCKYELAGLKNYTNWDKYINLKRDYERESTLEHYFSNPLNFNLVNRVFATYPDIQVANIPSLDNEIEIKQLGFDRIFDWCGLIEKCNHLHTVETAFCYIAKLLGKKEVTIYPRNTTTDFKYVNKLFPVDWKYTKK